MNRSQLDAQFTRAKAVFVIGLAFAFTAVQWKSWIYAAIGVVLMILGWEKACVANAHYHLQAKELLRRLRIWKFTNKPQDLE